MASKHKRPTEMERFLTRDDLRRILTIYHELHHTPWYVRLWRTVRRWWRRNAAR